MPLLYYNAYVDILKKWSYFFDSPPGGRVYLVTETAEIELRERKSVQMGWYLTELVLKGICRVHQPPGGYVYLVTVTQKWHLMCPNQSEWADIWLSWSRRYKQSPFNWFCNQPQAGWVIKWLKLAPIGPKSVQMGCNLLILELVLKGIWRVHQTIFVISHQWIEM